MDANDDPLGLALHSLRVDGAFYCRSELSAPWGLELPPMPGRAWFHVVTAGEGLLEVDGAEPVRLAAGDFALVPHGEGHRLRSGPGAQTPSVFDIPHELETRRYAILRHGEGGARCDLVCGAVGLEHPAADSILTLLPKVIHLPGAPSPQAEWFQSTVRLMAAESSALSAGGETVTTRLSDVLVIQAIRLWMETDPAARAGWLGALSDERIGAALAMIHRDPARDWSVAGLASEVAMSRSAFSARFSARVGEPPMAYLARWRMQVATERLRSEHVSVAEVARDLGYRSEAAFRRAFKRVTGEGPGAARSRTAPTSPLPDR